MHRWTAYFDGVYGGHARQCGCASCLDMSTSRSIRQHVGARSAARRGRSEKSASILISGPTANASVCSTSARLHGHGPRDAALVSGWPTPAAAATVHIRRTAPVASSQYGATDSVRPDQHRRFVDSTSGRPSIDIDEEVGANAARQVGELGVASGRLARSTATLLSPQTTRSRRCPVSPSVSAGLAACRSVASTMFPDWTSATRAVVPGSDAAPARTMPGRAPRTRREARPRGGGPQQDRPDDRGVDRDDQKAHQPHATSDAGARVAG